MTSATKDPLDLVFVALSDATRRSVVHLLALKPLTMTALVAEFEMSFAAVSKHVKVLENASLVKRTVVGRVHTIQLAPENLTKALDWISIYNNFWQSRLDSLEDIIKKD